MTASTHDSSGRFAYANHTQRFLGAAPWSGTQRFALVGVPFDGAVSNRPGARFGPAEIRRASLMLCDATHPHFDTTPIDFPPGGSGDRLGDAGDLRLPNSLGTAAAMSAIHAQVAPFFAQTHPVFLGGDHSITRALVHAAFERHGPLALIHFDAHCDTWGDHFGEPAGHGTWTRDVIEAGWVDAKSTVQIGIRSAAERSAREYVRDQGGTIYTARDLRGQDGPALAPVVAEIVQRIGNRPCYLSFDIDALDPAFAPGTGTPEPGGLSSTQALSLMEGLCGSRALNLVAMDCCEVAPAYDHAELTSLAAATLVWTYVCGRLAVLAG
jgi:agmatinase